MIEGHNVTFFRDDTYGGLAVLESVGSRVVTTMDYGICESDLDALLGVLERYADGEQTGEGVWEWRVNGHPMTVMSSIGSLMRRLGYDDDPLGEKAIIRHTPLDTPPDLPAGELMEVRCQPVKAGLLALAALVEKVAGLDESQLAVGFHPRPGARDMFGKPLPFLRVQVEGKHLDAAAVQQGLRQAFSQHEGLVRLTASTLGEGLVLVEAGFALPQTALEEYERRVTPTFTDPGKGLAREARYAVSRPLPEDAAEDLKRRVLESGCGLEITITERTVRVLMPCTQLETKAMADRVAWVNEQLRPWGGQLAEVGELREASAVN